MPTAEDLRQLALNQPEAAEADHHGSPSFRVAGKIFCGVNADRPRAMFKLSPEDQHNLVEGHPGVIEPVPGYWGSKGSTYVWYEKADLELLGMLVRLAWTTVAPARLRKTQSLA